MNRIAGRRLPALQFALLLSLVALAVARPPSEDDSDLALLPPDADNVEVCARMGNTIRRLFTFKVSSGRSIKWSS